ncbi:PCID2, partial [Symbiodinium pilosum]
VFDHNLQGADEKLTWAFNNCPEKALANRRRILLYLVPCKLRLGVLPTQELLHKYDLDVFFDVVRAIKEGNVQLFNQRMQELSADLIKMGTYLLMMRLKFMVLRNLTKGIFREVRGRLTDKSDKLDFAPFEHVFGWQDGCDADETAASLATLIYSGAVKGYLSHDRRKVVFAKDAPFPPPSKWRV